MRKSLQLQAEMTDELGACVFDVTLDCEDGAPVGGEAEHAALVTELALAASPQARVAVRVHPVDHPHFDADVATIAGRAAGRLTHLMVPKVESLADVQRAVSALDAVGATALPLHVLIDGNQVSSARWLQTPLVNGDARSYSIAAASVHGPATWHFTGPA